MEMIIFLGIVLMSAVFHEYMHAWAATELGDDTPRQLGRLSLNPIVHIDPFTTLLLPAILYFATNGAFMFAAAKPVPFNPYNLSNRKWGSALVGVAGPLGNVALALFFAAVLNFAPVPLAMVGITSLIVYANILLAVFNLVPIPPLDGSHLLFSVLPKRWQYLEDILQQYGFVLFIIFVLFFVDLLTPITHGLTSLLLPG